jgi:hypothetical protein
LSWSLRNTTQGTLNLRLQHLPEGRAQERRRKIPNMLGDTFPNKEHSEILSKVVAVVQEEIVGLNRQYRP